MWTIFKISDFTQETKRFSQIRHGLEGSEKINVSGKILKCIQQREGREDTDRQTAAVNLTLAGIPLVECVKASSDSYEKILLKL